MKTTVISFFVFHFSFFIFHLGIAQVIHVPAGQPTIQAGIDAANPGDTVLVAPGTYFENINFMGKAITVGSYYLIDGNSFHVPATVINGSQPDDPDLASVVTFNSGEDTTSILCGFTITGGSGTYLASWPARFGGGIMCNGSGARISHNHIKNNHITDSNKAGGGGICTLMGEEDMWVIIEYNTIKENTANSSGFSAFGGGVFTTNSSIIMNNVITDNHCENTGLTSSAGGGMCIENLPAPIRSLPKCTIITLLKTL